ncbi:peptidoglycan DD-metalloendopeptidase family protein [Blastomonas sp. AAP53]|uniref:M23 family metallopeptidase n=1 Tax=Blastomonas sp. AAP53 TaxID=1248760 RepID=UPI00031451FA|nr:peptidoglycan DD-metalloendopeptidase family protein [Blastomonas sp. AAP53]
MRERVTNALAQWFPDREFFMRSKGQIKFVKVSSRLQMTIAGAIAAALLLWLIVTLAMLASQYSISAERMALVAKQAEVESSASRVNKYRSSVNDVAADLEKRQAFLEDIVTSYIGEQAASDDASAVVGAAEKGSSDEAAQTARKISAMVPEAAGLARMEARQIAFVEQLTRAAAVRATNAETAIRKFGLNPDSVARASAVAQGGPFIPFKGSRNARLDPRFTALGQTLARMDALERGLVAIPSGSPALAPAITSGFGYRRDPFTGAAALHSGIDFKGAHGSAILAAAQGKVVYAGVKSGYGNCVEVAHGNGLVTRYAHLSSIGVRPGQKVGKGERLGGMGSTGRSTGTHLHFEVRHNDRAMNPRPFLEANRDVLEIQAVAEQRTDDTTR